MRPEDEPRYCGVFSQRLEDPNLFIGVPIEVGGRGKVVRLWAAHYHFWAPTAANALLRIADALSENPDHVGENTVTDGEMRTLTCLYGRSSFVQQATGATYSKDWHTQIVPLYGIIRPRRQVWVMTCYFGTPATSLLHRTLELYYSIPEELPRPIIDTINRARGKYRRT